MKKDNRFFYCYSNQLMVYLRYRKGIDWNCTGIHPDTNRQFYQFDRTEALLQALTEYGMSKGANSVQLEVDALTK